MATWQRIGVAVIWTLSLMVGGLVYQRVFVEQLLPLIDRSSRWANAVIWADRIAPLVLVMLALAIWSWVIAGAVQDERTVDRRRRVR
jgi:hypothetical protein